MKVRITILATYLLFLAGMPAVARAEEAHESEIAPEELLFLEVPVVVTASRKEQPVTEAPVAVTVITAEEIRRSGALNIPDVLRMVSGVNVITITARGQQVGIRGINGPINNRLLVLIDGRTVYVDFAGDVPWNLFPVGLEEIERIEVIKSPISSLYGANAFSGVINIITKTPQELKGTQANLTVGNRETYIGSIIHAGEAGRFHYKVSAGFDRTDEWGSGDRAADLARGNFYIGYDIGPEQTFALSGGRAHHEDFRLFINEATGKLRLSGDFDYLQADYRHGRFKMHVFRKSEDQDQTEERTGAPDKWRAVTYDVEAQYAFDAGKSHSFVIGADYRNIALRRNNIIPDDHSQDLYAVFIEDEFRISPKFRLIAGGRYDYHPLVKSHFSPRATLVYSPAKDHAVRLSYSQAFRNPTLIDSFLDITIPGIPFTIVAKGNTDLDSEGIKSYEMGYQGTPTERTTLGVNLFYNEYDDLIIISKTVAPPQIINGLVNSGDAWGIGGEIDLNVLVASWLTLFANYSYQRTTDKDDNPFTVTVNEKDRVRRDVPEHMVNAGVGMKFSNGLSVDLLAHWADGTERLIMDLAGNEFLARVRSYTIVNGRVGYTFWKEKAEASLYVFNLFDDRHFEYPPGINLPDRSSDPIGMKVAFKLGLRF